jgi:hypothetical protein
MFLSRSLVPLVVLTAIFTIGSSIIALHGMPVPIESGKLWSLAFQLILACWVHVDRQVRGFRTPYEFDAFVFFVWPFVIPYYLYKTRGGRGLLSAIGIYALFLAPFVPATIITVPRIR